MRLDGFLAIAAVCMVVLGTLPLGVAAVDGASSGFDTSDALGDWGGKTTPATADLFGAGGFEKTDQVVTHGAGVPGFYVKYANNSDARANLDSWLNSSDDRTLIRSDNDSNLALVAVPGEHVRRNSLLSWGADGLSTKSWVEYVEVEQRITNVEPGNPSSKDSVLASNPPSRTAKTLAAFNGGEIVTDSGVAYDDGTNRTHMGDVKETIGATSSMLPSGANGSGTVALVLDTGANVGTGSSSGLVFGNGTQGSEIRVDHGKNFVTGATINATAGNYTAIADGNLHGTYTAARIAGAGEGNATVRSPAHDAELAVGKVLSDDGSGSIDQIVQGLDWATSDELSDVDVISMSLGSPTYSKVLEDKIHDVFEQTDVSAIVVAAGNARTTYGRANLGSPADAEGVIAVAATTTGTPDTVESAYFSNTGEDGGVVDGSNGRTRGENVDVSSPGMKNTVRIVDSSGSVRSYTVSGTSMSAPDVSSAALVLLDQEPELAGDHDAVRTRLLETASAAPNLGVTETGNGLLNVSNALADDRPTLDQADARTEQAVSRDKANYALGGSWAGFLRSNGVAL
jgi:hypothetical protein